jgi:lipoate-protein ligase A
VTPERRGARDRVSRSWAVEAHRGSAAELHARTIASPADRAVWWLAVDRPALVLGSTQRPEVADHAALAASGVELVRRRSGGGAVLLTPDDVVWADVVVPAGDPLWDDDVGRAAHWLGAVWVRALSGCGATGAEVHRGPMLRDPWSSLVCFAGVGPGEVLLGGRKVVGISQRRTKDWARFQCAAYLRWDPGALAGLLAPPRPAAEDLVGLVQPLAMSEAELRSAFRAALP